MRRGWRIQLPEWCQDQRNQMTGPADDAELVVKMLNSGAPGVMLDLEDSIVNVWEHQRHRRGERPGGAARHADLFRQEAEQGGGHRARADGYLDPAARAAHSAGRDFRRGAYVCVAIRCGEYRVPGRSGGVETSAGVLYPEVRVGRGGPVVAGPVSGAGRGPGMAARLHQVHGPGGVAPAGFSDGGVSLQPARPHSRVEPGALGLHGQPDPFQSGRSGMGAAGPQYDSLRHGYLP